MLTNSVILVNNVRTKETIISSNKKSTIGNDFSLQVSHFATGSIGAETTVHAKTSTSLNIAFKVKRNGNTSRNISFTLEHRELVGEQSLVDVTLIIMWNGYLKYLSASQRSNNTYHQTEEEEEVEEKAAPSGFLLSLFIFGIV